MHSAAFRTYSISGMSLPTEAAYTLDCADPCEPLGAPHEGIPAKAWDGPRRLLRVFTCGAPSGSRALTGRLRRFPLMTILAWRLPCRPPAREAVAPNLE
jgi:hypothetical protein